MAQNHLGSTPFHAAVRRDNHEVTELLLDQPRLLINEPDHDGFTAVHLACINGSVGLCELLLSRDASVNVSAKDGRLPIHMAAYQGDATIVKMLIDKGTDCVNVSTGLRQRVCAMSNRLENDLLFDRQARKQ